MARLVLHIRNLQTGKNEDHVFDRSPIRIGRHPRNELPLDFPFVSQWHGIFSFDEGRCSYLDQGSTNGSYLNDKRLVSAQPTELGGASELRIGALRLRAELAPAAAESAPAVRTALFKVGPEAPSGAAALARPGREAMAALWHRALPQPGSVLQEDFLNRLRCALELLGAIIDRQSSQDAALESALRRVCSEGTGEALLAHLFDPEAPAGARADEVLREIP